MRISDIEQYNVLVMDKWTIFNGNNTGTAFHVFYNGAEIEYLINFSMEVNKNEPIMIRLEAYVKPRL